MYQRILDVSIWVFAIAALLGALVLVSWNTAASQVLVTPTPDGMWCITPTPTGDQWCMIPPVAVTVTPSTTPVPPTVPAVTPAGELTPFEPTATATPTITATPQPTETATEIVISPLPTATNTKRPRPTFEMTPVRSGSNAHLPIIWR